MIIIIIVMTIVINKWAYSYAYSYLKLGKDYFMISFGIKAITGRIKRRKSIETGL